MSDDYRTCIRGCSTRNLHFADCDNYGGADPQGCRGCVPAEAREGMLICGRCYSKLRHHLDVVPDLIALIRTEADPLKSGWNFDKELVGGGHGANAPAPVPSDLIDAANDLEELLRGWAAHAAKQSVSLIIRWGGIFRAGIASDDAYDMAKGWADTILEALPELANDPELITQLCAAVIDPPPAEWSEVWTVTRAMARWPLDPRARWSSHECPECGLRAVKITPPRRRFAQVRYSCAKCEWGRDADEDDGFWAAAFANTERTAA